MTHNDATCPRCGADNLTDYPVCGRCAQVAHFTHRPTDRPCHCVACKAKRASALAATASALAPEVEAAL